MNLLMNTIDTIKNNKQYHKIPKIKRKNVLRTR